MSVIPAHAGIQLFAIAMKGAALARRRVAPVIPAHAGIQLFRHRDEMRGERFLSVYPAREGLDNSRLIVIPAKEGMTTRGVAIPQKGGVLVFRFA